MKNPLSPALQRIKGFKKEIREKGFKQTLKDAGWKVAAVIIIYYLIRDTTLYIILPLYLGKSFFSCQ